MLSVAHSMIAFNANRQLNINSKSKAKTTEKLSSGYRINRAADDAASLAISEKLRRQIRGLSQGAQNIQEGISLTQIADGALNEDIEILQRINELIVKAANDTNSYEDRQYIQSEIDQLVTEVDRISEDTSFNERIYPLKSIGAIAESEKKLIGIKAHYTVDGKQYNAYIEQVASNARNMSVDMQTGEAISVIIDGDIVQKGESHPFTQIKVGGDLAVNPAFRPEGYYSRDYAVSTAPLGDIRYLGGDTKIVNSLTLDDLYVDSKGFLTFDRNGIYPTYIIFARSASINGADNQSGWNTISASAFHGVANIDFPLVVDEKIYSTVEQKKNDNIWIQASAEQGDRLYIEIVDASAQNLGIKNINITTESGITDSIDNIKKAISTISEYRSYFGSVQNRMEHSYNINKNAEENTANAESKLRDTDMAKEMVNISLVNILEQSGQVMLSQANQNNQAVLALLP